MLKADVDQVDAKKQERENTIATNRYARLQVQRLEEDVRHLDAEKHEHESTIIEQQDHIEKLQDSCRELQEAAQALQQDSDLKYAASIAQMKTERKQQVAQISTSSAFFASE